MADLTRRDVIRQSMWIGAALAAMPRDAVLAAVSSTGPAPSSEPTTRPSEPGTANLHWLEPAAATVTPGVAWGVPWARGECPADAIFSLHADGFAVPVQTWPLARWPDGSVRWSAHAASAGIAANTDLTLVRALTGGPYSVPNAVKVQETADAIVIENEVIRVTVARKGDVLIRSIERGGQTIVENAKLVVHREDRSTPDVSKREAFYGEIESATVEQQGPVRTVVKIVGKHAGNGRSWLPFVVRLYVYAGSDAVRVMHSFVFDGDQNTDFISGLGVTASVPMRGEMHDRHVRFAGEGGGLWAEAVRGLSGLRRDPGRAIIDAQLAGKACPPTSEFAAAVRDRLDLIPAWGDYTLSQMSADSFEIKKRSKSSGVTWIHSASGDRAPGLGYVGSPQGGLVFGLRDFWQRHPTQLDIRGANTDRADVTVWMYSPDGPAMDLRGYHDGMGMDTHAKQLEGLNITYEDWETGFSEPYGIARSSEITLWAVAATPPREAYAEYAKAVATPPVLVCDPSRYRVAELFGSLWNEVDRSTPAKAKIEDTLDWHFDYYKRQQDVRGWYGFWNYGDVMHTYDRDRHVWRYDVGGFAWDNSELSPDLWLWTSFLRTGRADIFRFAEAMTRHTGEVDVYHIGKWAGLGSRHNVLHWGDSAKQLRISTGVYRRIFYYLTADERVGDLLHELLAAEKTFETLDPVRKIRTEPFVPQPHALGVGFGTDWGSLATAFLTDWERTGSERSKTKLLNGMRSIGAMKHGFFTAGCTYDPDTGAFSPGPDANAVGLSHLSAVFGLLEICAELIATFDVPEFKAAWLQYCTLYNAPPEAREKALGLDPKDNSLTSAHSRLTAYAAKMTGDKALADRAWNEFFGDDAKWAPDRYTGKTTRIKGPAVLTPIDEAAWVSTNDTSQWGLAAIENLALVGDALPDRLPIADATTRPARRRN